VSSLRQAAETVKTVSGGEAMLPSCFDTPLHRPRPSRLAEIRQPRSRHAARSRERAYAQTRKRPAQTLAHVGKAETELTRIALVFGSIQSVAFGQSDRCSDRSAAAERQQRQAGGSYREERRGQPA